MTICGARTKKDGSPCQKSPMSNGSGKCANHGGKSLRGKFHPNFLHGRRSKAYIENAKRVRAELRYLKLMCEVCGFFE